MITKNNLFGPGGHPNAHLNLVDGNYLQGLCVRLGKPERQVDRIDNQDAAMGRIDARRVAALDLAETLDPQA